MEILFLTNFTFTIKYGNITSLFADLNLKCTENRTILNLNNINIQLISGICTEYLKKKKIKSVWENKSLDSYIVSSLYETQYYKYGLISRKQNITTKF